jgi:very-short-patch-repair endonuclease
MSSFVPKTLKAGPFLVREARDAGLNWEMLQTKAWRRLSRGQYAWTGLPHDIELQLRAVHARLPEQAGFSGYTAAWLLGQDFDPCDPIEVTAPRHLSVRTRAGVKLRRAGLEPTELVIRRGFRVTTPLRTTCDLGSRRDLVESTVAIDMALHAGITNLEALRRHIEINSGAKGIKRLRRAVGLADPRSESPMETRLRLELRLAHLPIPDVQVRLEDGSGGVMARADLYYPDVRLVIEFDGQNHKERMVQDARRQNALFNAGFHVLRFTAADLKKPGSAASQVRRYRESLLRKAG